MFLLFYFKNTLKTLYFKDCEWICVLILVILSWFFDCFEISPLTFDHSGFLLLSILCFYEYE